MQFEKLTDSCKLYSGDCIAVMQSLPKASLDLIIGDPPYKLEMPERNGVTDLLRAKNIKLVNEDWDKYSLTGYLDFTERWLHEAFRLLKPTGSVLICGTYHNSGLVNYVLQRNQWMIINEIAWYKRNAVPNLACRRLTASYETILWAAVDKHYTFNYADLKDGTFPEDHLKKFGKQMRNVWDIPTNGSETVGHPTQKPVKLYERLIQMACRKDTDSIILDPFAGSGTCAVAADRFGYHTILIEQEPLYQQIIRDRIIVPTVP